MIKNFTKNSERGQAIILIAFAIVGMIAIVGLMTDSGILLIEYARLKRGIDAASVAAAQQFRKGYDPDDLKAAGEEFLRLNQSDVTDVTIETCATAEIPNDPILCTDPESKLVRVTAKRVVDFGFMRVIGFNSTTLTVSSVGEAASIDLVMVIDTSSSMAYETTGSFTAADPGDDPAVCNNRSDIYNAWCQPMEKVKENAKAFIASDLLYFPYDRVGIVTMTSQNVDGFRNPTTKLALSKDEGVVYDALDRLTVYEPPNCDSLYGSCRNVCTTTKINDANTMAAGVDANLDGDYDDVDLGDIPQDFSHPCYGMPLNYYLGQECPVYRMFDDPSSCGSSNIGGAINEAYGLFGDRQDSFWVIIALVGGPANSTNGSDDLTDVAAPPGLVDDTFAFGFCPENTWDPTGPNPFCRDASASTRHAIGSTDYDADDYARDIADRVVNPTTGGVTIFTIGLGDLIRGKVDTDNSAIRGDDDAAEKLLQYIARTAGNTYDPITGDITGTANHGEYYFAPDASKLNAIFLAIAKNIFTRISH